MTTTKVRGQVFKPYAPRSERERLIAFLSHGGIIVVDAEEEEHPPRTPMLNADPLPGQLANMAAPIDHPMWWPPLCSVLCLMANFLTMASCSCVRLRC